MAHDGKGGLPPTLAYVMAPFLRSPRVRREDRQNPLPESGRSRQSGFQIGIHDFPTAPIPQNEVPDAAPNWVAGYSFRLSALLDINCC